MIDNTNQTLTSFACLQGKRIGILGGTFDPPHNGHLEIAQVVKKKYQLDAVVFIPAKKNPLKFLGPIASDLQRLAMLELLIEGDQDLFVSRIEIDNEQPSYTYITLEKIHAQLGGSGEIFLILGTDNLFDNGGRSSLANWKNKDLVFELADLVFVARGNFKEIDLQALDQSAYLPEQLQEIKSNIVPLNLSVSSTEIRRGARQGYLPKNFLPDGLSNYILANNIYN